MDPRHAIDGMGYDMNGFASQQPPQIFGAYGHDGSPMAGMPYQGAYFDAMDGGLDDSDPKRRRIARACDMCRKKKIKCDGKLPKCSHCTNYKTECVFTQVEKKRNPPKGAKYIEGLENRLGRMESLLKMSGLLTEEEAGRTDLGTLEKRLADKTSSNTHGPARGESPRPTKSGASSTHNAAESSQQNSPALDYQSSPTEPNDTPGTESEKKRKEVENLSDMMCSLVTNNVGETRYIGSSSAFSIFSSKGIEWVNQKTGDNSFQETIQDAVNDDENKWMYWKPEIFGDIFVRRVFKPLPPKEEALSLFKDFFENFNCMFPLYHEPTFMHLVDKQYSRDPYEGSGWWASINVVLALAYRIRVMSNVVPQEDDQKAWLYLKNAMGVLTELTLRNTDLLSVQALLGMSLFLCGTPNPQPSFFLISAAIRQSHSIGLHKRGAAFNLNSIEAEQRKRVFWIAYMLDKDTCLRSGRPPAQDDDDMNVDLPSIDPPDNIGNIPLEGGGKVNLFRLMCEFAIISSKVYRRLYSVQASRQTDGELLNTIGELDKELEIWKDSIPLDFRPEHEIKTSHAPLILHIVVLHFSYYNCLTTIHRMSVHHGYWTSRLSDYAIQGLNARPLNPRVFSSAALCVAAARASIHLIKYIPQGDFACVWLIIYFPVSALVTVFANILQNPQDARARADIKLMDLVVNFLTNVVADEGSGSLKRMLSICSEFARIARIVIDKAEKDGSRRKRKVNADDMLRSGQTAMAQVQAQLNGKARPHTPTKTQNGANVSPRTGNLSAQPVGRSGSPLAPNASAATQNNFDPGQTFFGSPDFNAEYDVLGQNAISPNMDGSQQMPSSTMSPLNMAGAFQQPFLPQDLWQMPMTFEWDWADFSNTPYHDNFMPPAGMPNNLPTQ